MANLGFSQSTSDYVLVVDGDVEFADPEALNCMLTHCIREDVGVVGAKTLFADDTIRHAGMMVGPYESLQRLARTCPVVPVVIWGVCGALAMFRRFLCLHDGKTCCLR